MFGIGIEHLGQLLPHRWLYHSISIIVFFTVLYIVCSRAMVHPRICAKEHYSMYVGVCLDDMYRGTVSSTIQRDYDMIVILPLTYFSPSDGGMCKLFFVFLCLCPLFDCEDVCQSPAANKLPKISDS